MALSDDQRSDRDLLVASRQDPDAFAALYRRHIDGTLRYFRKRGLGPDQAFDLAAETFAAALEGIDTYRPRKEPGAAWLYAIARNVLAMSVRRGQIEDRARRKLGVERIVMTDDGFRKIDEISVSDQEVEHLHRAVERLPEAQRKAVQARVVEERDYEEIASELQCSEQLVRQNVSRGLKRLGTTIKGMRS